MIRDELRRKRKRAILGECPVLALQGYEDIDCQQAVVHFEGEGLVIETKNKCLPNASVGRGAWLEGDAMVRWELPKQILRDKLVKALLWPHSAEALGN